jgi:hypothetical protein
MSEPESYDLDKSAKGLGKLYPILKDKNGNIIDGFHRQNCDPDWPSITLDVIDDPVKLELARLATNFCRRIIPHTELQNRIAFLVKNGLKPEEISDKTGISVSTVYRHMPQELKNEKLAEAQKEGHAESFASAIQTVTTQERIACEFCKVGASEGEQVIIHSKPRSLCDRCKRDIALHPEKFSAHFQHENGLGTPLSNGKKVVVPSVDSWKEREAHMKVQHSKLEELVLLKLQNTTMTPISTDRGFDLVTTTPDFYFPRHNLAVYMFHSVGSEDDVIVSCVRFCYFFGCSCCFGEVLLFG